MRVAFRAMGLVNLVRAHRAVAAIALAVVLAAAGVTTGLLLTSGPAPAQPVKAAPAPSPSSSSPAPPPPRGPLRSPFTGKIVKRLRRVLAVKIDNLVDARPQTGLTRADIVYVIPVEGGLTRFLAVFSSHYPPVIGPVRSARLEDLALIRQFGRPAFAFSGAAPGVLPRVEHSRIVNLYDGRVGGYFRDNRRFAPHNLYAHTRQLLAESRRASRARDIGFRFGPAPAGGKAIRNRSVSYPAASFRFTWSAKRGRWLVWMDGSRAMSTEDGRLSAPTVVIQYTRVRIPPATGPHATTPYAHTIGTGRAIVLRDGRAYRCRWSRKIGNDGTVFRTDSGQRMTFARGPVWVLVTAR